MTTPPVSPRAAVLADVLAALFEHDRELAGKLNAAQQRLMDAGWLAGREIADAIHHAFTDYQTVAEHRRRVGADVGETTALLMDAMRQSGFTEDQARQADVWALRDGVYRPASAKRDTLNGGALCGRAGS
jgi:hypothetical protein